MKKVKAPPGAKRLIESLRNLGYECSTAVADLVDNSIAAQASEVYVDIYGQHGSQPPHIVIADDGHGMERDAVHEAMRFGAFQEYSADDLGKYGLGLKTASLSQCRILTVASKAKARKNKKPRRALMRWDLDYVYQTDDWDLLAPTEEELPAWEQEALANPLAKENGTVVLWTSLDEVLPLRAVNISFQNTDQQTVSFPLGDKSALRRNEEAAKSLVRGLGRPHISASKEGMHIWKDIDSTGIIDFLNSYTFSKDAAVVNRENLSNYIRRQNGKGELRSWDVVVPRGNPDREPYHWAGDVIARRVMRSPTTRNSIRVLSSPGDIAGWKKATGRTGNDPHVGCLILYAVDKTSGMPKKTFFASASEATDIIGLVLVFPDSRTNVTVEYVSQQAL